MAQLRRASLILLAAAIGSPAPSQTALRHIGPHYTGSRQTGSNLSLSLGSTPGSLRIGNPGATAIRIARAIGVEARTSSGWQPLVTEFNAVAACTPRPDRTPLTLPAHAALAVQPWRGYSCSGQCEDVCRGNIHYGHGPFRFVITVLPERTRVTGPAFVL